jgi:hypothetical protein
MAIGRLRSNDWLNHRMIDDPSHADLKLAGAHPSPLRPLGVPKYVRYQATLLPAGAMIRPARAGILDRLASMAWTSRFCRH